jgi:acyl-CoA synthetase (NDP forming)/RimJ/RimL family protein N-acetyltransferase
LADGATAHVRPIVPDDAERLSAFHERQSPQSIYYRYFSPRPHLSDRDLEHLTTLDYRDRMALVALRSDEVIGVARYDRWEHRREAEVAFFVDDRHHGRGVATVLLEHLAARARQVGISAFTATVLPDNRKMIGVFTSAGFDASTRFADGVVEVHLDLQPTPDAERRIEERSRTSAARAVQRLLTPRSVAVIGAGRRRGSVGHETLRNLVAGELEGPVWPINPEARHVASVPALPNLGDVPGEVDLVVIAVPAEAVPAALADCGRKGVPCAVVLSSGFAETGPEGEAAEAELVRIARRWGIRVLGPNCMGLLNTDPAVQLYATFARPRSIPGGLGLLSESGMVGAAIVDRARELGLGISSFVALGNRADVSGNDLLGYWEDDARTTVVGMYIESFGNPRHFSRVARRLARKKPVVAVKSGRQETAPHDEASEEALLAQNGVIRVRTLAALLDTARLLAHQPLPQGPQVAVIGNAGGSLAIAADACVEAGLELVAEPVDLGIRATAADITAAVTAALDDAAVRSVLVVFAPSLGATTHEASVAIAAALAARPATSSAVVACMYGSHPNEVARSAERAVPVYEGVDAAAAALARAWRYARWLQGPDGDPAELSDDEALAARAVVARALGAGNRTVPLTDVAELLEVVGIAMAPSVQVSDVDEAVVAAERLGFPVALKAAGRAPLAKSVAAGLALDLADEDDVRGVWDRMVERLGPGVAPAVVQRMEEPGVDVAVSVLPHPSVGPVLALAPGGAAAALAPDAEVRVLPLSEERARLLAGGSRLASLMGQAAGDRLAELLVRVAALVESVPEIVELDLNPVLVRPDRAVVTDARVRVVEVRRDPRPPLRRVGE